ncbi:hypothetical protein B484DRAFT_275349 [Ochromonadaceae sp. CCMP2298]|nr:hypothetical protein B484DRAFT_275349 [Ochromonadaceae sp. CCMP2298]
MLRDVLKNTPKLALHERECTALVTSFCKGEAFHWREQLQDVTALVVTLCRERVVQRRLSLHMSSRSSDMEGLTDKEMGAVEDARSNLRTLADRLLNYVRIQMSGEIMQIHLPIDNVTRRTVQTGEGLYTRIDADQNLLYAGVRQLLWATIDSSPKPARQASLIRTSTR